MEVGQLLCGWQVKETIRLLLKWDVCASKLTNATFALRMNLTRDPRWHGSDASVKHVQGKNKKQHCALGVSALANLKYRSAQWFFFSFFLKVCNLSEKHWRWVSASWLHARPRLRGGTQKAGRRHRKLGKTKWKRCLVETAAGFSPGRGYVTATVNEAFPNWFRTFPSQKQETLEGHKKLFSLIHWHKCFLLLYLYLLFYLVL